MREIKFRAKVRFNGTIGSNHEWVYSSFLNLKDDRLILGGQRCKRKTLGQYTGLKDKNRRELYEGDVIEVHSFTRFVPGAKKEEVYRRGVVFFDSSLARFSFRSGDWMGYVYASLVEKSEIIGNVHENPELLTETKVSQ